MSTSLFAVVPRFVYVFLWFLFFFSSAVEAKQIPVADEVAFNHAVANVRPGDVLVLREGQWPDAKLLFSGRGTANAPITLRAAVPGKTILSGKTQLRIGGEYLTVDGLWFQNPDPVVGDTIEFRDDKKRPSRHCRLTNSAITLEVGKGSKADAQSRWINLYGENNRVDHCLVQGKVNKGATLVVWLDGQHSGRHHIDHNYFGPREKLGENGAETIRVGDSKTSMQTAACVIEQNLFERCDGEAESISNKSCGNIYRNNTFLAVSGALTLRHGNGCLVENNIFLGQREKGTGGIRIIGEDHIVRGNYLEELDGSDARSGISLMRGIPDSPLSGYFQVKRALVEANTLVDCKHSLLIGLGDEKSAKLPPIDCMLRGNVILAPNFTAIESRSTIDGVRWDNNTVWGRELGIPAQAGITWKQVKPTAPVPLSRNDVGPAWHH